MQEQWGDFKMAKKLKFQYKRASNTNGRFQDIYVNTDGKINGKEILKESLSMNSYWIGKKYYVGSYLEKTKERLKKKHNIGKGDIIYKVKSGYFKNNYQILNPVSVKIRSLELKNKIKGKRKK